MAVKKRNVRKVLKVKLAPSIVKSWFNAGSQPHDHLDKLFQFLTNIKTTTCPEPVITRLRESCMKPSAPASDFVIKVAVRLRDAKTIQRRLYTSPWYTGQIVVGTEITSPKF